MAFRWPMLQAGVALGRVLVAAQSQFLGVLSAGIAPAGRVRALSRHPWVPLCPAPTPRCPARTAPCPTEDPAHPTQPPWCCSRAVAWKIAAGAEAGSRAEPGAKISSGGASCGHGHGRGGRGGTASCPLHPRSLHPLGSGACSWLHGAKGPRGRLGCVGLLLLLPGEPGASSCAWRGGGSIPAVCLVFGSCCTSAGSSRSPSPRASPSETQTAPGPARTAPGLRSPAWLWGWSPPHGTRSGVRGGLSPWCHPWGCWGPGAGGALGVPGLTLTPRARCPRAP